MNCFNPAYKTMIIIDDEESLVGVFRKLQDPYQLNVLDFHDALNALDCLWKHRDSVSLITTDNHHLGIGVSDFAWIVKNIFPNLPVIIISGHHPYNYHLVREGLIDESVAKPFLKEDYLKLINRYLKLNLKP